MITCPGCARVFPEVVGAPTQQCPHCAHEFTPATTPPVIAMERAGSVPADPVGAITTAWRVAKKDHMKLLLLWLPVPLVDLAVDALVEVYGRSQGFPSNTALLTTGEQMELLGVALPLSILAYTLRLALWTFIALRTFDIILGGQRLMSWRRFVLPALLAGFVLTLTYIAGFLLVIVGFFVFLHWFIYVPAQLANGAPGVGAAFETSRRFSRERRTFGFTALIVLLAVASLTLDFGLARQPGWIGIIAPAFAGWLFGPIVPLLVASFVAISVAQPAPAPAPAGVGVVGTGQTRSTTACPRCRTLIAYDPTGSAVDVTCSNCGYAGRVL